MFRKYYNSNTLSTHRPRNEEMGYPILKIKTVKLQVSARAQKVRKE